MMKHPTIQIPFLFFTHLYDLYPTPSFYAESRLTKTRQSILESRLSRKIRWHIVVCALCVFRNLKLGFLCRKSFGRNTDFHFGIYIVALYVGKQAAAVGIAM